MKATSKTVYTITEEEEQELIELATELARQGRTIESIVWEILANLGIETANEE